MLQALLGYAFGAEPWLEDIETVRMQAPSDVNLTLGISLMVLSFLGIMAFFGFHMRRIVREIAQTTPTFDLTESESKMEFTIAERGGE